MKKFKDFDIPETKKQEVINEWNKTLAWVEAELYNLGKTNEPGGVPSRIRRRKPKCHTKRQ